MALNLLSSRTGVPVAVHHRAADRVADVLAAGATFAATPRELAGQADLIVLMLPDLPQVEEVLAGPDGLLAGITRDTLVVISSTSSASGLRSLQERLTISTEGKVTLVDAPVSGGEEGAIAGTLSIMVGGEDADVARALPVLATMGNPVHLGPLGSGEIAKFCNQMIVASTVMALGEAAVLAQRSGLDLGALFGILEGGYAGSRVLATRKDRIVSGEFGSSGMAKYMVKDLTFASEEAAQSGTVAPQLQLLLDSFTALTSRGFGDQDISATRAYVESLSSEGTA
jgi:2-hydroxy-3-oxopropionate reductase